MTMSHATHEGIDLPFEVLATRYNFRNVSPRKKFFTDLLIRELVSRSEPRATLDVGCGRGMAREVSWIWQIRRHTEMLWGIEPDERIAAEPKLFDHFQHALMETAKLPEDYFDLVYSHMVMEHVADPEQFLRAVYRCLKPGGRYYFFTPNGNHYFGLITRALRSARLDDIALRLLIGNQAVETNHYPVQYKFNTHSQIDSYARTVGFEAPEYVMVEETGPTRYFRGPLRPFLWLMNLKRRVIRNPNCLISIVARLTKPESR